MPVIQATQEAGPGEFLDPGGRSLLRPEFPPLHSTRGNKVKLHPKKKKKKKKKKKEPKKKKQLK